MGGDKVVKFKIIKDLDRVEERIINLSSRLSRMEKNSSEHEYVDEEEIPFSENNVYEDFDVSYGTLSRVSNDLDDVFKSLKAIKRMMYLLSALCVFSASLSMFVFFYTAAY